MAKYRTALMTPAELEELAAYRDACLARGFATGPCDRPAMEAAVRRVYRTAGLAEPELVIWMSSPLGGLFAAGVLRGVAARGQLWGQLWDQLGDQLRGQLGDQLRGQLRDQLNHAVWGGQELPWLAWFNFARTLGVTYDEQSNTRLDAMLDTADLGWWWPYEKVAILTDRPTALYRDGQGRLHHETGPAVAYGDGWAVHAWHGTRVPPELIEGRWSTGDILRERNAEVRRCAIEHMGWPEFVQAAGLRQVGKPCPDPGNPGHTLALYDVPEAIYDEPVRVLLCTNGTVERDGTRRRFGLTCPASISDPLSAAAWGYGLTAGQYAQMQRRA